MLLEHFPQRGDRLLIRVRGREPSYTAVLRMKSEMGEHSLEQERWQRRVHGFQGNWGNKMRRTKLATQGMSQRVSFRAPCTVRPTKWP